MEDVLREGGREGEEGLEDVLREGGRMEDCIEGGRKGGRERGERERGGKIGGMN